VSASCYSFVRPSASAYASRLTAYVSGPRLRDGSFVVLDGREDLVEPVPEHLRARLGDRVPGQIDEQAVEDSLAVLAARHLAPAELHGRLDLVAVRQELQDVL